jgi:hypothetical protein
LVAGRGCSELQPLPFPVHRLLTPSLMGRRASLAGLLLILSSLHASDCTLSSIHAFEVGCAELVLGLGESLTRPVSGQ